MEEDGSREGADRTTGRWGRGEGAGLEVHDVGPSGRVIGRVDSEGVVAMRRGSNRRWERGWKMDGVASEEVQGGAAG